MSQGISPLEITDVRVIVTCPGRNDVLVNASTIGKPRPRATNRRGAASK